MVYIREPAVSGMFYPGNPEILRRDLAKYMENAVFDAVEGEVIGMISPHAGYVYSAPVAAYGYKSLLGRIYDAVIIIAPSHRVNFEGVAIQNNGGYRTPLGIVDIDEDLSEEILKEGSAVNINTKAHIGEHSLEVQLPFLQVVLNSFKLVPLIMGTQDLSVCEELSRCLYEVLKKSGKHFLIVGSSDLSHYYPYDEAVNIDKVIVEHLEKFNTQGLAEDFSRNKCEACGFGTMITTMMVSEKCGATGSKVLKYANSGEVSGDKSGVVGYVSSVFYKPSENKENLN
ncbi:MAG: AmmeMemoRadiSam system protein B [Proteobacteria bacterium]|nr:AmmeMemoRadiSam system protein B [Pseudomonadota bacterium]